MAENPRTWSIADAARLAGVTPAMLRTWEERFGFPRPLRLPGGHRRFGEADIGRLQALQELRRVGVSLPDAIARVRGAWTVTPSIYGSGHRADPTAPPVRMAPGQLLRISRAIEDECLAHGGP